ncbi:MAG: ABC transporter transmembrane domain-containing protein [Pseudomonadota bacterium]|nr:ABC transporter transmembrane domain-containing protein [Pseudomonadota bacterium]MEE3101899.1 ABC transporter transmembrane domain-containing protein [Pseudomonadota bacterium]
MTLAADRESPDQLPPAVARDLLRGLIGAAGWQGDARAVADAMPHDRRSMRPHDLVRTLSNLGIAVETAEARLTELQRADMPCLFLPEDAPPLAALARDGGRIRALVPGDAAPKWVEIPPLSGVAAKVGRADRPGEDGGSGPAFSLSAFLRAHGGVFGGLAIASLMINLLAFATPMFVMALYDHVIPTRSGSLLAALVAGLALAFGFDAAFRLIRAQALVHAGARIERGLVIGLFAKLLALPMATLSRADLGQHLARFRQFESLRDAFVGPNMAALLDLPFAVIFLAAVFVLAPGVGWLILALVAVFVLVGLGTLPLSRRLAREAAAARAAHQRLMLEIATNQRAIRRLGAEGAWRARVRPLASEAAATARRSRQLAGALQAFGQALMTVAGVGAVVWGAEAAMQGDMSLGALIAVMTLVWRVLAPFQALFVAAPQLDGQRRGGAQADAMLSQPEEPTRGAARARHRGIRGEVRFSGVALRFEPTGDPVLAGVSAAARDGEILMIPGRNGAGKTSLLRLVPALWRPTAGAVSIGGIDLRQLAVDDLRAAIGFAAQTPEFFHGSVRQNLALAEPLAEEPAMLRALREAGIEEEIRALPDGLDTRLTEGLRRTLPPALLQSLSLARTWLKDAPIVLLDEPANGLDPERDALLLDKLRALHGRRTVLMVTNRPSHLALADRIIYLDEGRVALDGAGESMVRKVAALNALRLEPQP